MMKRGFLPVGLKGKNFGFMLILYRKQLSRWLLNRQKVRMTRFR